MEAKEYTTIDRAALGWPSGPWDGEPDKAQWLDETTGLPCLAVRHSTNGHWCGYVGVSPNHPLHGKHWSKADCDEVHGGLTFSDYYQPTESEKTGICHVPGNGESDNVWWFGFDCAHSWDSSPRTMIDEGKEDADLWIIPGATYKTLHFVKRECASLARQLLGAGSERIS